LDTILEQPPRESVRPDELHAYDRVVARQTAYGYTSSGPGYEAARPPGQEAGPYFGALLQSPLIADHISELGVIYRSRGETEGSYEHKDREWIDIVMGHELGFNMWGHIADGMAVGVRPEAVIALCEGREDDLTDDERSCTEYVRAFINGRLTAAQWEWVLQRFGVRGGVEYTAFCGHLLMTIRLINAFSAPMAGTVRGAILSDAEVVERCRRVLAGDQPLPDPRARIPTLESPIGS
jgi:hypothetical protein